jgi:hypothetical protein
VHIGARLAAIWKTAAEHTEPRASLARVERRRFRERCCAHLPNHGGRDTAFRHANAARNKASARKIAVGSGTTKVEHHAAFRTLRLQAHRDAFIPRLRLECSIEATAAMARKKCRDVSLCVVEEHAVDVQVLTQRWNAGGSEHR